MAVSCVLAAVPTLVVSGEEPRVEVVATGFVRPIQLAFDGPGRLVVLSHGRSDTAAAEIIWLDLGGAPVDASRLPRVVVPFATEPRKAAFGSLAVDPSSGDLLLGEENGNRIYRLSTDRRLTSLAVGLQHLVGGSAFAVDGHGRLVVVDYLSADTQLRSETPPPPGLDLLSDRDYQGPLIFRIDPNDEGPRPRRLDLVTPLFPRRLTPTPGHEPLPRFVSVAARPDGEVIVLSSLGEVWTLTAGGDFSLLARLPSGHYHRISMALAPDGSVFVSSGLHIREIFRVSAAGVVTTIARGLGDPEGIAVDRSGALYVAETALHRIIRIAPVGRR